MNNETELIAEKISEQDNTINVEMTRDEIGFLKGFIKKYNPKKIVEVGISAGGNTVNLLQWKDKDAKLFSIDIAHQWYQDKTKLSGFMAEELDVKDNWKLFRGFDYLDVCEEIGDDIDFIIIDTVHSMPGEFFTFIAALPHLKDGCIVVLHDIHLNMWRLYNNKFGEYDVAAYCTGLLFGGVSSNQKWTVKSDKISNIAAFVVDETTRNNIKDIFHILCAAWMSYPAELNLMGYSNYVREHYPIECSNLFNICLTLQAKYFYRNVKFSQNTRIDVMNSNTEMNTVEVLSCPDSVFVNFPEWFKYDDGQGAVVQTSEKYFDIIFKCVGEGLLKIALRGPDVRDETGKRVPNYVEFKTFRVNNKEILKDSAVVWHDYPYRFEKNVNDGEIVGIHVEWEQINAPII